MNQTSGMGEAEQILHRYGSCYEVELPEILQKVNKPVIVISITGASGDGKSFILDMLLRHLRSTDWINDTSHGFMQEDKSSTTGIMMWSHPFPVTLPTGEEAVIVLMDTQGASAGKQDVPQAQAVQTLATLLSSLQIFNVMDDLSDDALEQLRQSIELGQRLSEVTGTPAFQKLMFLVRDWTATDELPLGAEGGGTLVTKWLEKKRTNEQLETARSHIGDCFSDVSGFLLPYPGTPTLLPPEFHGSSGREMDPEFVVGLKEMIQKTLEPENLIVKVIAGNRLMTRDLCTFFSSYVKLFSWDKSPEPEEVVQATMEASLEAAVDKAKFQYWEEMKHLVHRHKPALDQNELMTKHKEAAAKAKEVFNASKKMSDPEMVQQHLDTLLEDIEKDFTRYIERVNTEKRNHEIQKAEKKKREEAQKYIIGLVVTCTEIYTKAMQEVIKANDCLAEDDLKRAHLTAKDKAMDRFDVRSKSHDVKWDCRFKLSIIIGVHFLLIQHHNNVKKDANDRPAARANMKGVKMALKIYRKVTSTIVSEDKTDDDKDDSDDGDDDSDSYFDSSVYFSSDDDAEGEYQRQQPQAVKAAVDTFKSFQRGKEEIIETYLDTLNKLIDEEEEMNKHRFT